MLKSDIARFSAFKEENFNQTLLSLLNKNGILPTRKEFKEEARKIDKLYNNDWLNTEYDFTVAKAQSALQFKDYESRKHLYPNIRYVAIHDGRTRALHLKFDGLVLPLDHAFWKTHLPPWDYGCRCGTEQTDDDEYTPDGLELDNLKPKPGVGGNPAVSGKIIADDHPYYDVSKEDKKAIEANLKNFKESKFTPMLLDDYEKQLNVEIDRSMFSLLKKDTPLFFDNPTDYKNLGKGAYYNPVANYVRIPIDARRKNSPWYAKAVVHHEYGHAIDHQIGLRTNPRLTALMDDARKLYSKKDFRGIYDNALDKWLEAREKLDHDSAEKHAAILDTIASLDKKINRAQTHSDKYWSSPGKSEAEFIAHMFENKYAGNEAFEKLMPDLYKKMKDFELLDANVR